jgi:4-hydroxybenzoate polyprenyltransferase
MFPAIVCFPLLQAGAGHSFSAVQHWSVWFMSLISAGIAVASVVVNDYFDLKLDATNAPDKPLPSGKTHDHILAVRSTCVLDANT